MNDQPTYDELANMVNQMQSELQTQGQKASELHTAATASNIVQQQAQNLIEWQLNISEELEIISHQLRGDVIVRNRDGSEYWTSPKDPDQKIFNEKGAQEIEKIIRNYLIKNILLSNFGVKEINQRVFQFAHRLRRFIYMNFEDFGMDTEYKQKHFEMIVMNITDQVEAAYLRALGGQERESLRRNIQVTQSGTFGTHPGMYPSPQGISRPQNTGSKLNPMNWLKG